MRDRVIVAAAILAAGLLLYAGLGRAQARKTPPVRCHIGLIVTVGGQVAGAQPIYEVPCPKQTPAPAAKRPQRPSPLAN